MAADLAPAERAAIGAMWDFRARAEHETAANYQDLGRRLRAAGAPATMLERVAAAHADERRHEGLCARMAERWGHPSLPLAPATPRRIAPHDLDGGARLAYEMVALFCVSESINATLLLRSWQRAEHAETRAILHELLADEVRHSQIGWAYVSSLPGWQDDIASRMPRMLAATTHDEHFLDEPSPRAPSAALTAHGLLSQDDLRDVFREAMEEVVLPGLALCGIETTEAKTWLRRRTAAWGSG